MANDIDDNLSIFCDFLDSKGISGQLTDFYNEKGFYTIPELEEIIYWLSDRRDNPDGDRVKRHITNVSIIDIREDIPYSMEELDNQDIVATFDAFTPILRAKGISNLKDRETYSKIVAYYYHIDNILPNQLTFLDFGFYDPEDRARIVAYVDGEFHSRCPNAYINGEGETLSVALRKGDMKVYVHEVFYDIIEKDAHGETVFSKNGSFLRGDAESAVFGMDYLSTEDMQMDYQGTQELLAFARRSNPEIPNSVTWKDLAVVHDPEYEEDYVFVQGLYVPSLQR